MDIDLAAALAGVFLLVIALFIGFGMGANWLSEASCKTRWSADFQPTYGFLEGCLIVVDGKRIPSTNYRVL